MKKIIVCALFTIAVSACGDGKKTPPETIQKDLSPLTVETISPESLHNRLLVEQDYKKSYKEWPGYKGLHEGFSVHGTYHRLLVNATLRQALPVADGLAPHDSIIVKETFDDEKELRNIYVMAKIKGFDPENNDWYWAKYSSDGSKKEGGKLQRCIECHLPARDNDYVFLKQLNGEG